MGRADTFSGCFDPPSVAPLLHLRLAWQPNPAWIRLTTQRPDSTNLVRPACDDGDVAQSRQWQRFLDRHSLSCLSPLSPLSSPPPLPPSPLPPPEVTIWPTAAGARMPTYTLAASSRPVNATAMMQASSRAFSLMPATVHARCTRSRS